MSERILRASVEGDAEWLDFLLLVVIEDTLSKGPRSWLRPEGLVAAVLLTFLTPNLFTEKPHGRVGMRGVCRVLKAWAVGEQGLSKVPILRTPRCDTIPSRLDGNVPSYPSPLHLLQQVDGLALMGALSVPPLGV
ncbi:unnamed protein product [Prunus armeniaca]